MRNSLINFIIFNKFLINLSIIFQFQIKAVKDAKDINARIDAMTFDNTCN